MKLWKHWMTCVLTFMASAIGGAAAEGASFAVASTGQNVSGGQDTSYTIVASSIATQPYTGNAIVVTQAPTQAPGWPVVPGAKWIATDANQSNSRNGCCAGTFKVTTKFSLKDASGKVLDPSQASLTLTFAADDGLDVYLYPTGSPAADAAHKIYSAAVFNAPVTKTFTIKNAPFAAGVTDYTLQFDVNNAGLGPTGLAVYAEGSVQPCLGADGKPCGTSVSVSSNFITASIVSGVTYSLAPLQLVAVAGPTGGGAQAISVAPASSPACPINGSELPVAIGTGNTGNGSDASASFRVFGTDPSGRVVPPGVYQSNWKITAGGKSQDMCVVANVMPKDTAAFSVDKTGLLFNAQVNQTPATQTVTVSGGSFDVAVTPYPPTDAFVTATRGTGASANTITVSATAQSAAKAHYALITITPADKSLAPAMVGVVLNVTATAPAADLVPPDPIIASQDSTKAIDNSFTIKAGSGATSYTITPPAYVTVSAASGSLAPSGDTKVAFTIDPAKLKLGINKGAISVQLTAADGSTSTQTIQAWALYLPRLAVAAPIPGAHFAGPHPQATTNCTPGQLLTLVNGLADGFQRMAGFAAPVSVQVMDDCANPISNASVVLNFSNGDRTVSVPLVNGAAGLYTATWTPVVTGSTTVTALAMAGTSVAAAMSGSYSVSGTVTAGPAPVIAHNGVVNNLYPVAGAPLAPGTVTSIYGLSLAPATGQATSLPLPTTLQDTSVTVGGVDLPLYSVSAGQINVQIPTTLLPYRTYPVVVRSGGTVSAVESITITPAGPGVVAFGDGGIVAQHSDYQLVDANRPARPGEAVIIYLVGMGATTPPVGTGEQASGTNLAYVALPPVVKVNGNTADVLFAGLVPGGIGLYQIVFNVPTAITTSGSYKVTISQSGYNANSTTIPVVAQ